MMWCGQSFWRRMIMARWLWMLGWVLPAILAPGPRMAAARPLHVRESSPAATTIIRGRHTEYVIHFDGPVDHYASRMEIVQSGRVVRTLTPLKDSAPDVLFASDETPPPGRYV